MYNSPGTPGGTGWQSRSSTYTLVLAIGTPMGGAAVFPASTAAVVDQIVVSVGPYRLVTDRAEAASVPARSAGSASPPTRTRTPARAWPVSSATARQRLGVACITVTDSSAMTCRSRQGSWTSPRPASTTAAPLISGMNSSRPAMSNPTVVIASRRSRGPSPNRSRMSTRKLRRLPRETTTPLGLPVEPEV
nr:hypothetical protein [Streptosporangium amethystogenes]